MCIKGLGIDVNGATMVQEVGARPVKNWVAGSNQCSVFLSRAAGVSSSLASDVRQ